MKGMTQKYHAAGDPGAEGFSRGMSHVRCRAVMTLVAVLVILPVLATKAQQPERGNDFVSTPTIPQYALTDISGSGKGLIKIEYAKGEIQKVTVLQKTGIPMFDTVAVRHVKEKFRVRPGAQGTVILPIGLNVSDQGTRRIDTGRGTLVSPPPSRSR